LSGSTRDNKAWKWKTSNNAYVDRSVVFGGQGNVGSCCHADTTCNYPVTPTACQAVGDRFRNGPCPPTQGAEPCCPYPFADADHDGDVDQADFGAWQICYTGTNGGVPSGCECWNRDWDNDVDGDDYTAFNNCWTGPNVKYVDVVPPPPNCNP
jgi:hypothetical protein